jgi:hypothetical protein
MMRPGFDGIASQAQAARHHRRTQMFAVTNAAVTIPKWLTAALSLILAVSILFGAINLGHYMIDRTDKIVFKHGNSEMTWSFRPEK